MEVKFSLQNKVDFDQCGNCVSCYEDKKLEEVVVSIKRELEHVGCEEGDIYNYIKYLVALEIYGEDRVTFE